MTSTAPAARTAQHYVGLDQRATPRSDVYARVPVTLPDGRPVIVTAVNISSDGILIRHEPPIADGGVLTFSMPVIGKVRGFAVWSVGGRSGIRFDAAIGERDYQSLLKALGGKLAG